MPTLRIKPPVRVNGQMDNWFSSGRVNHGDVGGHSLGAQARRECVRTAMVAPVVIGDDAILQCSTDGTTAILDQIFGFAGRAGYKLNSKTVDTAPLYSRAAWQTLVPDAVKIVCPADLQTVEFAISTTALSGLDVKYTPFDVGGAAVGPLNCSAQLDLDHHRDVTRINPGAKDENRGSNNNRGALHRADAPSTVVHDGDDLPSRWVNGIWRHAAGGRERDPQSFIIHQTCTPEHAKRGM